MATISLNIEKFVDIIFDVESIVQPLNEDYSVAKAEFVVGAHRFSRLVARTAEGTRPELELQKNLSTALWDRNRPNPAASLLASVGKTLARGNSGLRQCPGPSVGSQRSLEAGVAYRS